MRPPLRNVLLAMPHYGLVEPSARDAFWKCVAPDSALDFVPLDVGGSALTDVFNKAWATAGNLWDDGQIDGFAMIHADVSAEAGWLDVLHAELLRLDVDAIAAHIPIKCRDGISSTAVDVGRDMWRTPRLTMPQIHALPETITDDDVGAPLLLNTGLWLCRLGPWLDSVHFQVHNGIRKVNGKREAVFIAEDWDFSRQLHAHGLRVAASRKVKVMHHGSAGFGNHSSGGWEYDRINGDALTVRLKLAAPVS